MRNNLKDFRKKIGFTQRDFSSIGAIPFGTYCNIEKGRTPGNATFWINLGVKFDLTAAQLKGLMELS